MMLAATKKDDDAMYSPSKVPRAGAGTGGRSSGERQRLVLKAMVAVGVVAAVSGAIGLLLLSREFETGNGVANRLGILVPKALAEQVHEAFDVANVSLARRVRRATTSRQK